CATDSYGSGLDFW
nr:immunoglobulin heavy chain junction region [Macaca mulatta]MOV38289.1 immunoglobulin heavy chain junction region [Macaca mulatta]MOV38700.1 immunoglobulin heavy chain junction region [Macaca mulatta]MOV38723.1 immunoglobulin heavy chain junction region [Macaca mulatta]MOV38802.1 immunoglobulin heavy chain junction region [Macaca mulatta]